MDMENDLLCHTQTKNKTCTQMLWNKVLTTYWGVQWVGSKDCGHGCQLSSTSGSHSSSTEFVCQHSSPDPCGQ